MLANTKGAERDAKALATTFPGLNERQSVYLQHVFMGKTKAEAAREAGYSEGYALIVHRAPAIQAAIAAAADRFMVGEMLPAALGALWSMLNDTKTSDGVRKDIAFGLMDRAGFDAKRHQRQAEQGKEANELSRDELRAAIDKLEQELEGRMKDITPNGAPDSEPTDSYAVEFP